MSSWLSPSTSPTAGHREDPAAGELREARALDAGRVEVAQQVEPGADEQLAPRRVGDVGDGRAREQQVVLDRLRIGGQRLAGGPAPRLHDVVVGQVLADRDAEVDEPVERQAAADHLEPGLPVEVGRDRVLEQVEDLRLVDVLAAARRRVGSCAASRRPRRPRRRLTRARRRSRAAGRRRGCRARGRARRDERQRVGHRAVGLDRPAGQDVPGRVERVRPPRAADRVGEDVDQPALQQPREVGRARRARPARPGCASYSSVGVTISGRPSP